MFGKRSSFGPSSGGKTASTAPVEPPKTFSAPMPGGASAQAKAPQATPVSAPVPEARRSDEYYITKSMIFGALIEAIDLSQLALGNRLAPSCSAADGQSLRRRELTFRHADSL